MLYRIADGKSYGLIYIVKPEIGWVVYERRSDYDKIIMCGVPFSVRHGRRFSDEELTCQAYNAALSLCDTATQKRCAISADLMRLEKAA